MGTSNTDCPKSPTHPLLNLHLFQGPTAQNPGCPPLTQGLRTSRLLSLPQITCCQALSVPPPYCSEMHPTAWHSVWVTSHSASGSLLGIFCMGIRNDCSELQTDCPLMASHCPQDKPRAPQGAHRTLHHLEPHLFPAQPQVLRFRPTEPLRSQITSSRTPAEPQLPFLGHGSLP